MFPPCAFGLLTPCRTEDPFGKPPTPSQSPKEPVPFVASMLALPDLGFAGRRGFDLRLPDPHAPHVEILNLADHDKDMTGAVLRRHLRQLTHTKKEKLGSFSLAFSEPTDVKPFQADYSLLSDELRAKVEGKLRFKFSDNSTKREQTSVPWETAMLLNPQDVALLFRLHRTLMFFVNQRLKVLPDDLASPEEFAALAPEVRLKVRDALLDRTALIQSFVDENPASLPDDELDIVRSWQHLVAGKFYLFRYLKQYTVFLSTDEPPVAYGVLALADPFEELVGPYLPILAETVLLPFKGMIVYDGLLNAYRISFGPGIRRSLNDSYKEAKARQGIVTSLPMRATPLVPAKAPKAKPRSKATKEATAEVLATISGLLDQFCREHLNDEYAVLCRKLAEKLARKRPSPLLHGKPQTWASGIVRTIGWVNFLGDPSQTPHMKMTDIDEGFGVSPASGAAKSKAIRDLLRLRPFDPDWTLPSRMDDNPLVWMLNVNGLLMDIRHAPREAQEVAFQKGLIPYIPADRRQEG